MALEKYNEKRDFRKTSEPKGKKKSSKKDLMFVVQKHDASRLHYDFRLELDGVLKSWAVPKGPSLNTKDKRLAMMVEDHPIDYGDFEGVIPEGNYGAGNVIVWDTGTYHAEGAKSKKESEEKIKEGLEKGDCKFLLDGEKLKGGFVLVRLKSAEKNSWLLIKHKDEYASTKDILKEDKSVLSNKTVDEIAESDGKWEESKKKENKKTKGKTNLKAIENAPKQKMPSKVKPMLATLVDEAFDDKDWLFEIKWDGYRAIAELQKGKINLHSRNNNSFNKKFSPIAESLKAFDQDVILDGEVVVLDDEGRSSFQLLQNYQRTGKGNLIYYVFDILYLNGHDLTGLPLIKRKEILRDIFPELDNIQYSDHIEKDGLQFYNAAAEKNLEGIIAKNGKSEYQINKRSREWLKIKTELRQEAVIGGFTEPKGSRQHLGSLVLGVYDGDDLIYIGHSGGGFTDDDLEMIRKKLNSLERKTCPFKDEPKTNTKAHWVTPKIVCEVKFSEWTDEGLMRHPIYLGLREDKSAEKVTKEIPKEKEEVKKSSSKKSKKKEEKNNDEEEEGNSKEKFITINRNKLKLTNLDKIYWPDEGYTKGDLINYYRKISGFILPYLKERPESLNRHPNGINGDSFYQKDVKDLPPNWIKTAELYSESNDKKINYLICNHEAALVYLANLGCIEINPWFSKLGSIENPDYLVIDLDPEDISFDRVVETALVVKDVLDDAGAESYCKTSGATGLHIYVPLGAKYDYNTAKDFAHIIARLAHRKVPKITSTERSPSKRQKKVYLDYLQNRRGQTLAAPYSVRPKPGATVATPLEWKEVKQGLDPREFTIKTIHKRLEEKGDIFTKVLGKGINLEKCIGNLEEALAKT